MEFKWSWKYYTDDWNSEIFNLDSNNKNEIIQNIDLLPLIQQSSSSTSKPPSPLLLPIQQPQQFQINNNYTINDINSIYNQNNNDDLFILKNILKLLKWLSKNNNKENILEFIKAITWIKNKFKIFSDKLNLHILTPRFYPLLCRSSYKLCPDKHKCINYYMHKKKCKLQHFPYNNLYNDCISILHYLNTFNDKREYNIAELLKCINTINFVTEFIVQELENHQKSKSIFRDSSNSL